MNTIRCWCVRHDARILLPVVGAVLLGALPIIASSNAAAVKIGMAKTFFLDRTKGTEDIAVSDFKDVLNKTTGLNGELYSKLGAMEVAEKLANKQLDFAIFHAHEFAWAQKKYPSLQVLMIAADKGIEFERAFLIVRKNSPAKSFADLRGKKIDIPYGTRDYCRVYLEKLCVDTAKQHPDKFFAVIQKSDSPNEAMDQVARGTVEATVVNSKGLDFYKEIREPVYEKNLRVFMQSGPFPHSLVAYKPGAVDPATLTQFRDGLLKAHTTEAGRDMMKDWNIDAFRLPPADFNKQIADVLKAYPTQLAPR